MVIGVTGQIASGKSSVVGMFARFGLPVVSADQLARDVVLPGSPGLASLVDVFGDGILDRSGQLDRPALGQRVFTVPDKRRQLEALLHPLIGELAERRIAELCAAGARLVIYEAPLLYEACAEHRVDKVLVVLVGLQQQLERLCRRDGIDLPAARQRLTAQFSQGVKAARADYLIDNSRSLNVTEVEVRKLYRQLLSSGPR